MAPLTLNPKPETQARKENLQLRALLGEGGAGPVDAGQLARWHREMDRSTQLSTH